MFCDRTVGYKEEIIFKKQKSPNYKKNMCASACEVDLWNGLNVELKQFKDITQLFSGMFD